MSVAQRVPAASSRFSSSVQNTGKTDPLARFASLFYNQAIFKNLGYFFNDGLVINQ